MEHRKAWEQIISLKMVMENRHLSYVRLERGGCGGCEPWRHSCPWCWVETSNWEQAVCCSGAVKECLTHEWGGKTKEKSNIQGNTNKVIGRFFRETLQARREWHDILNMMKGKNLQPRLLSKALIQIWRRNWKLHRLAKAKRIQQH